MNHQIFEIMTTNKQHPAAEARGEELEREKLARGPRAVNVSLVVAPAARSKSDGEEKNDDDDGLSCSNTVELSWAEESLGHDDDDDRADDDDENDDDNDRLDHRRHGQPSVVSSVSADASLATASGQLEPPHGRMRRRSSLGSDVPTGPELRESLERRHSELESCRTELARDRSRLERDNDDLRYAVAELVRERDVARAQANEWRSVLADATSNVGRLGKRCRELEAEADVLREECARLREERDRARSAGRRMRRERNEWKEEAEAMRSRQEQLANASPSVSEKTEKAEPEAENKAKANTPRTRARRASASSAGSNIEFDNNQYLRPDGHDSSASNFSRNAETVNEDRISRFPWLRRLSIGKNGASNGRAGCGSVATPKRDETAASSPVRQESSEAVLGDSGRAAVDRSSCNDAAADGSVSVFHDVPIAAKRATSSRSSQEVAATSTQEHCSFGVHCDGVSDCNDQKDHKTNASGRAERIKKPAARAEGRRRRRRGSLLGNVHLRRVGVSGGADADDGSDDGPDGGGAGASGR